MRIIIGLILLVVLTHVAFVLFFSLLALTVNVYRNPGRIRNLPKSIPRYIVYVLVEAYFILFQNLRGIARWWRTEEKSELNLHSTNRPILCIHGYGPLQTGETWRTFGIFLREAGLTNFFTIDLKPPFGDVTKYAEQVRDRVERILRSTGHEKVDLIGHSMGGIVARYYIEVLGGTSKVERCVTIGSPHHGTYAAILPVTKVARQLRPGSDFLAELNASEGKNTGTRYCSVYSEWDEVIFPAENSRLRGAENVRLSGHGHMSPILSRRVAEKISQFLKMPADKSEKQTTSSAA